MTVGIFLDNAAAMLRRSQEILRQQTVKDPYGLAAAVQARNYVYRELWRFLALLRPHETARPAPARPAALPALATQAEGDERARLLARVINGAALGLPDVRRDLLRSRSTASAAIIAAADAIAMAAEVVATHIAPSIVPDRASGRITWHRPTLSREAGALHKGAQRTEILGETARLVRLTLAVDRDLATFRTAREDTLLPQQWDTLHKLASLRSSPALRLLAGAEPAHLLRNMAAIAGIDRSSGPRSVTSWADVTRAISAVRTMVYRQSNLATLDLVRATARLGFAITAAVRRIDTSQEIHALTAAHGQRWSALATAATVLADTRDALTVPLNSELDTAQAWIRTRLKNAQEISAAEAGQIIKLQAQIGRLCAEIREALRFASDRGRLLRAGVAMATMTQGGVVVLAPRWVRAGWKSPAYVALIRSLATAAHLPALPLNHQTVGVNPDQRAHTAAQASSVAWPATTVEALQHGAQSSTAGTPSKKTSMGRSTDAAHHARSERHER